MTRLEKLIQELCPDGVKYLPIPELFITRNGYTPSKANNEFWENGTIPWFRMEDIRENGRILTTATQYVSEKAVKGKLFPADSIIIATSATIGEHALIKVPSLANQRFTYLTLKDEFKDCVDMMFVFYYCFRLDEYCKSHLNQGNFASVDMKQFAAFKFPLPPLPVQREIVRILDNFTELTAELTARKQQYEFYRDQLLTFAAQGETILTDRQTDEYSALIRLRQYVFGYVSIELGSIGKVSMCKRIMKAETSPDGDVPFYKIGTFGKKPDAYISREKFEEYRKAYSFPKKGDVLISAAGTIGRTVIYDGEDAYYQDSNIVWIDNDESVVLNRYLFYCYQLQPWAVSEGGTIARLYNDNISRAKISVPSIEEQKRIIEILDRFDALCTDLSSGLPAEIEARQKQYEYYRDKLLSFEEKI